MLKGWGFCIVQEGLKWIARTEEDYERKARPERLLTKEAGIEGLALGKRNELSLNEEIRFEVVDEVRFEAGWKIDDMERCDLDYAFIIG